MPLPIPPPPNRQDTKERQHTQRHQKHCRSQARPKEARPHPTDLRAPMRAARRLLCRGKRSRAPALVRRPAELAPLERAIHRCGCECGHECRERDVRTARRAVPARERHIHRAVGRGGRPVLEH